MQHLTARITADAKIKTFDSGRSVVNFNVVKNRTYKNRDGQRVTESEFYECSYWLTTKVAPYLTKGQMVELIGEPKARAYNNKDGEPVGVLQFRTARIIFHTAQKKNADTITEADHKTGSATNDDLPF
jgi:single-strand DNA-binding protein